MQWTKQDRSSTCYCMNGEEMASSFSLCNPEPSPSPCRDICEIQPNTSTETGLCIAQEDRHQGKPYLYLSNCSLGGSGKAAHRSKAYFRIMNNFLLFKAQCLTRSHANASSDLSWGKKRIEPRLTLTQMRCKCKPTRSGCLVGRL